MLIRNMKKGLILIICLLTITLTSCASHKSHVKVSNPSPVTKPIVNNPRISTNSFVAFSPVMKLVWDNNYNADNEVTVIIQSPDLRIPMSDWATIYVGTNGYLYITNCAPQMFFEAYNAFLDGTNLSF
jgi:hypothetical protein